MPHNVATSSRENAFSRKHFLHEITYEEPAEICVPGVCAADCANDNVNWRSLITFGGTQVFRGAGVYKAS